MKYLISFVLLMNVLRVNAQTYNTDIQGTINATGYYLNGVAFTGAEPRAFYDIIPGNGNGLRFWQSDAYKIHMGSGAEYQFGPVTDYSIKMNMDGTPGRGWTWGISGAVPIAAIGLNGNMQIAGLFTSSELRGPVSGAIRVNSGSGILDIGAMNDGWAHLQTDRPKFYFNRGITVDEGFVSSYDEDLNLQTSGSTRLTILNSSGYVGIGNVSPGYKLDVNGIIGIGGVGVINTGNSPNDIYINSRVIRNESTVYPDGMYINYGSNGGAAAHLKFFANGTAERMRIDASNGNVGIGTPSPAYTLDVNGPVNATSLYVNGSLFTGISQWTTSGANIHYSSGNVGIGTPTPYSNARLHVKVPSATPWGITAEASLNTKIIGISHNGTSGIIATSVLGNDTHSPLQFQTADTIRMTINETGVVAIGTSLTTNPNNYLLAVNGKIGTKEVRVEKTSTTWPDYVFRNDYPLPDLKSVESYIQEHKHLKDVPSAKEVAENGHELGSMDAVLLRKIEELTLYILQQEKKNEDQNERIKQLEEALNRITHRD